MRVRALTLVLAAMATAPAASAEVLYTVDESLDTLCTVDTATGIVTPIGSLGVAFQFGDLAYDSSSGVMYMIDGWGNGSSTPSSLYRVDLTTGAATFVGSTGATSLFALTFDPVANKLYAAVSTLNPLGFYEINRTTGVATFIGDPGVGIDGLTYLGGTNQIVGLFAGPGSLHTIDPATGASTVLSGGGGFVNNCGIAWVPNTNSIYSIDWSGELYQFDVAAGFARTTLWSLGGPYDGLAFAGGVGCPNPVVYCTAGTTSNGCVPAIGASGPISVASSSGCLVNVAQVEGQRSGIILYGLSGGVAFPWGSGSTSFFCVKSPTARTPQQNSGGVAGQCDGALSIDLRAYLANNPTVLGNPLNVGATFSVQGWFRDPPAPRSTNLSDAVRIQACP
jgi:hypothetical protein